MFLTISEVGCFIDSVYIDSIFSFYCSAKVPYLSPRRILPSSLRRRLPLKHSFFKLHNFALKLAPFFRNLRQKKLNKILSLRLLRFYIFLIVAPHSFTTNSKIEIRFFVFPTSHLLTTNPTSYTIDMS